jgi:hypothetical protein
MRRVASSGLLDLRVDCQPMPEQRCPQGRTLVGRGPKMVEVERRGDAGHHDHGAIRQAALMAATSANRTV